MTPDAGSILLLLIGLAIAGGIYADARRRRIENLRQRAHEQVSADKDLGTLTAVLPQLTKDRLNAAEVAACASVSAAEFLWSWATIDPNVIAAADFSSTASIHAGVQFVEYIRQHYDSLGHTAQDGFLDRLAGYVGEQRVADLLINQGHVVHIAESANQPVWDMVVDGHLWNVKNVGDTAAIKDAALHHLDVTFAIPEDAHGHVTSNMLHIHDFNHDAIKESIKDSIAAAHGDSAIHGLWHHVPWVTVGFSAYRNVIAVQKGREAEVAIKHFVTEVLAKGTTIVVVSTLAKIVTSTFLGPVGVAVATVGAVAAAVSLINHHFIRPWKERPLKAAQEHLKAALDDFGRSLQSHLPTIRYCINAPFLRFSESLMKIKEAVSKRKRSWRWLLWPDYYTVLLEEAANRGEAHIVRERSRLDQVNGILDEAERGISYTRFGLLMANVSPFFNAIREVINADPKLLSCIASTRQKVFYERKQLNPDFVPPHESRQQAVVQTPVKQTYHKICPECHTPTSLETKICVRCGHRYRTEFNGVALA